MFYLNVFKALNNVDYAVVGGFALTLHGAVRGTVDLDIVISFKKSEFQKVEKALLSLGLSPRLPVKAEEVFAFREEYISKRNLIAWSFVNSSRPSEIVDIILTHNKAKMKCKTVEVAGIQISVASIKDLIKMKKIAARPQDLEDIKMLEALEK
jgi:hypothetical protein